ncbi:MAG: NAD(P)H-hydrate dehydratase [Armatimonadota bacterium]
MKLLTAEQMRALDRHCIDDLDIPSLDLMERAGHAVAVAARELQRDSPGLIVILCGKGNNGGDGLVAGRQLQDMGVDVRVVLPFAPESLSPDAKAMYDRAVEQEVRITESISDETLADAGVVIDALLGTGVTGPVHGVIGELIQRTNELRDGQGVVAVDLPSGVETDTGKVYGRAMHAQETVTMGLPKPCLVLYPGAELAGRWTVADIGFPPEVVDFWPSVAEITEREQAASWVPQRPPNAFKGSVGEMLVIAGSFGMTGAAAMACTSAYRSGAGLVRLALPSSLTPALNAALTEVVFLPMPETSAGTLSFHALPHLLSAAKQADAVLIGPGLSRNGATQFALRRLVPLLHTPLVVDADALTAMAGHDELWQQRPAPTVITPHPGEMSRLLGRSVKELEVDRIATAKEAAARFNVIVVFKGAPTVIAAPDGRAYVNPTGNAGLAVAGTGDVLAGSITALIAQHVDPFHAAALATYLGGRAAEILADDIGILGMTALDLIEGLPYALAELGG